MSKLAPYNHIILDCDGVVFDSNALKVTAFEHTLRDENIPEDIIAAFIANHKKTGGISRYVKFRALFSDFLNVPFDEEVYQRLLDRYGKHCKALYGEVPATEGLFDFLNATKALGIKLHIASGSDEEELKAVFELRGLKEYFENIFGSPTPKNDCVTAIIAKEPGKKYLMIGDAVSDYKAAEHNGIDFIAMTGYSEVAETLAALASEHSLRQIENLPALL